METIIALDAYAVLGCLRTCICSICITLSVANSCKLGDMCKSLCPQLAMHVLLAIAEALVGGPDACPVEQHQPHTLLALLLFARLVGCDGSFGWLWMVWLASSFIYRLKCCEGINNIGKERSFTHPTHQLANQH